MRNRSPIGKAFIIVTTLAANAFSKLLTNSINDIQNVKNHIENWNIIRKIFNYESSIEINVDYNYTNLNELFTKVYKFNNYSSDNMSEQLLKNFMAILRPILEPVTVDYSNAILAEQIY